MIVPRMFLFVALASPFLAVACAPSEETDDPAAPDPATRVQVSADSDEQAIELAQAVMATMGGWPAWDATKVVSWRFFGRRMHYWDRDTGLIRIEWPTDDGQLLILMNLNVRQGRAWKNGIELEGDERSEAIGNGYEAWVNDSYWMFMPYKLLDPGVTLKHAGEGAMEDGRASEMLDLTFDGVGVTPENRYIVHVATDTGLVEQWDFYQTAADEEPRFRLPWKNWQEFGGIRLATSHGNDEVDWEIAVHESLPATVFTTPDPVSVD